MKHIASWIGAFAFFAAIGAAIGVFYDFDRLRGAERGAVVGMMLAMIAFLAEGVAHREWVVRRAKQRGFKRPRMRKSAPRRE